MINRLQYISLHKMIKVEADFVIHFFDLNLEIELHHTIKLFNYLNFAHQISWQFFDIA